MRKAVSHMADNLQSQKEAVSDFQSNIKILHDEMCLLEANMRTFNRNLGTIRLDALGVKARRLAALMESVERSA